MVHGGKNVTGITSPTKIVANVFISFIGAGLLGLPYAFKESGILEGAIIMSIVGYLSVAAMLMLIDCKYAILSSGARTNGHINMESKMSLLSVDSSEDDEVDHGSRMKSSSAPSDLTYGDIGYHAFGPAGKSLVDITIIISQIGFCCGYLIYLCDNLKKHLNGLTQAKSLIFLLPPLYGLTMLRHLNKLAYFSLFAQVSNVLALAVVFWFDFEHSEEIPFDAKEVSLKGMPFFFAISIYCYEGAGMILSLEESVAEKKKSSFRSTFIGTMVALTILYIAFGVSGYLSFGPDTQQFITLNLPHGSAAVIDFAAVVKLCLGVSFFFTYPMMLFPVTHLFDKSSLIRHNYVKGNIVRLVLVFLTGITVVAVPSFAVLSSLIGATCCTMLAFIMPAAFHTAIFKKRLTRRQRWFNFFLISLGVLGTFVGLIDVGHRIAETRDAGSVRAAEMTPHLASSSRNASIAVVHTLPPIIHVLGDKIDEEKNKELNSTGASTVERITEESVKDKLVDKNVVNKDEGEKIKNIENYSNEKVKNIENYSTENVKVEINDTKEITDEDIKKVETEAKVSEIKTNTPQIDKQNDAINTNVPVHGASNS